MTKTFRDTNLPLHQQDCVLRSGLRLAQQDTHPRVDAFNADEAHWRRLEPGRRLRRKILRLTRKQCEALDRLEFAVTRPPDECIANQSLSHAKIRL